MNKEQREELKRLAAEANALAHEVVVVDVPHLVGLLASLESAEAECERLRKDAGRYRFIRDVPYTDYVYNVMTHQKNGVMDSAIDKAMEAK